MLQGNREIRRARPSAKSAPRAVQTASRFARENATNLIGVILMTEVFWLILHRMVGAHSIYHTSPTSIVNLLMYAGIAATIWILSIPICRALPVISKINIGNGLVAIICFITIVLNLVTSFLIDDNARYVSGALTGSGGILYVFSRSLSLLTMILLVKQRMNPVGRFSYILAAGFTASYAFAIDGLASAMTLSAFLLLLINKVNVRNVIPIVLGASTIFFTMIFGFNQKFNEIPSYLTPDFFIKWIVSRFAISSEQGYKFLSGDSMLNRNGEYLDIIRRSIESRIDIILGRTPILSYPKSVSEALYFDMYGTYEAGSSPGFMLGIMLNWPIAILLIALFGFAFMQLFSHFGQRISLFKLFVLSLLIKGIYSNIPEFLVVVSPSVAYFAVFMLACAIEPIQKSGAVIRLTALRYNHPASALRSKS